MHLSNQGTVNNVVTKLMMMMLMIMVMMMMAKEISINII